ncbi:hypothetical protein Tdes44962_MAKER02577 [Teratosphaeria destructans]|uniref:DUF7708 domain-containing protein n=1 Tax=Teratosphaeria destructans TaxID=418781 RepID=A0A9W7ST40_9PEZI|nr:hypothetical protein Tdes44962_MAKER02577 [Teratosphaeria destructans]
MGTIPYGSLPAVPAHEPQWTSGGIVQRRNQFCLIMDKFKQDCPDPNMRAFNIRQGHHSWKSVLNTADAAAASHDAKRRGPLGIFTNVGKSIASANGFIEPALDLLPCGEYTSIVCGGIKMLFIATTKVVEVRERILAFFKEAPYFLEQAEVYQSLYEKDENLDRAVQQLGVALLKAIEAFVNWYDHGWKRPFIALLKQKYYGEELEVLRQEVQQCADKVSTCADNCDKHANKKIATVTESIFQKITVMLKQDLELRNALADLAEKEENQEQLAQLMSRDVADVKDGLFEVREGISAIQSRFEGFLASTQQAVEWQKKAEEFAKQRDEYRALAKGLEAILRDRETAEKEQRLRDREIRRQMELAYGLAAISPDDIRWWLGNCGLNALRDIEHYIESAPVSSANPKLTQQILAHPGVLAWYSSSTSQILFVEASRELCGDPGRSLFVAIFSRNLQKQGRAVVVTHFCARSRQGGGDSMVTDMLASLICQLITAFSTGLDFRWWSRQRSYEEHRRSTETRDLVYLCSLFKQVVSLVPHGAGAIFVLIDEFHILERNNPQAAAYLYQKLRETASLYSGDGAHGRTFKVLAMTPVPNGYGSVSQDVPRRDLVQLDDARIDDDRGEDIIRQPYHDPLHRMHQGFDGPFTPGFGVFGEG